MKYIHLPNAIFDNFNLTSGELMVYVALLKYKNVFGYCQVKNSTIASLLNVSERTVSSAISRLADKGLVTSSKRISHGRQIANRYSVSVPKGRFVKISTNLFNLQLSKSEFKVYLYLLKCKGNNSAEAVPSLNQMAAALHMSKRTIIDATNSLGNNVLLYKQNYKRKTDRRTGHNRYFLFTAKLKTAMLYLLSLCKKGQKKIRATLRNKATRKEKKFCLKLCSNIYHVLKFVKVKLQVQGFFLKI